MLTWACMAFVVIIFTVLADTDGQLIYDVEEKLPSNVVVLDGRQDIVNDGWVRYAQV